MAAPGVARRSRRRSTRLAGKPIASTSRLARQTPTSICDVPDTVSGIALSLAVNGSGVVRATTTPLITVEEMDTACKKSTAYWAPGA